MRVIIQNYEEGLRLQNVLKFKLEKLTFLLFYLNQITMAPKNLLLLLIIILLGSCGVVNKSMNEWMGHHKSELYQAWGPPSRITEDGNGGEILIDEYYSQGNQTPGKIYSYGNQIYYTNPQSNTYSYTRMFYVNSEGIIYHWWWKGL